MQDSPLAASTERGLAASYRKARRLA
jgi:hypothetical protein